jgi:MFS family permease
VSTGHITFWELVVGGFLIGLAQSPSQPARFTLVSDIVDREYISNANALNAMALNMTQVIGPGIGGAMIGLFGPSTALWLTAVWYPLSFVSLWPIRDVGRVVRGAGHPSAVGQLVEGLRIVLSDRFMASVLFVSLVANIFLWPVYQAFMPVFAKDVLHLGPGGLGALLTCSGVGALIGSLAIAFLGDFRRKGALFIYGTAAWGACWALFALSRTAPLSFVLMVAVGLASSAFGVLQSTLLLMVAPAEVRGRAMGLQELAIGILPVATLLHGAVAAVIGVPASTATSGVLLLLLMLWLAVRVPGLRRFSGVEAAEPTIQQI